MPVVNRHAEDGLLLTVGKYQPELKRFPARVHVWMQTHELHVFAHFKRGVHLEIRITRGNLECAIGSRERQHTLLRGSLCKNKPELGLVYCGFSVRRVMHFKDDVGAGFDQLSLARMQNLGGLPRSVADKKVARQCTRVRLLVNLRRGRDKKNSGLLVLEVIRARLAVGGDEVVDDGTVGWAHVA